MTAEPLFDPDRDAGFRDQLRRWVRAQVKGQADVSVPDLARLALQTILAEKKALQAAIQALLQPLVYEEVRQTVANTRSLIWEEEAPSAVIDLTRPTRRGRRGWATWLEHAGDRHVLLLEMTIADLDAAEAERRQRGDVEYGLANLWSTLKTRMEPGQKVKDVWTIEEIEEARRHLDDQGG